MYESPIREPLVNGNKTYGQVSAEICRPLENKPTRAWWLGFTASFIVMMIGFILIGYTVMVGIGVWGVNKTVGWAWDITNFVFWIGIGHAGTLISAILLLFRQKWRTGVNRAAEAMTIFAVI